MNDPLAGVVIVVIVAIVCTAAPPPPLSLKDVDAAAAAAEVEPAGDMIPELSLLARLPAPTLHPPAFSIEEKSPL